MNVVILGASGMVGGAVLRECLLDPEVERVLVVSRTELALRDAKLRTIVHDDFGDLTAIEDQLEGYDACFFCIGVTSAGMTEAAYRRVTVDFALAAARAMIHRNPKSVYVYVSGEGADSSQSSSTMWARVKGEAENAILAMPFREVFVFRPGYIQPLHGIVSRTTVYRIFYAIVAPFFPILRWLAPRHVTTTENIGRAMLRAASRGAPTRLLRCQDIEALAADG